MNKVQEIEESGGPQQLIEQLEAAVKSSPKMSVKELVKFYLVPTLKEIVVDYEEQMNDLDDTVSDIQAELDGTGGVDMVLVAQAVAVIQGLQLLLMSALKSGELFDENGFTEKAPMELQGFYAEVMPKLAAFQEAIDNLENPNDDQGGEEEDDEEDDDDPTPIGDSEESGEGEPVEDAGNNDEVA